MASDQPTQRLTIRPNAKRQVILLALALMGLVIGYGFGFVFKPSPVPPAIKSETPHPFIKQSAPLPPASAQEKSKIDAKVPPLPLPNVVLPENASPQMGTPIRAYEEALPKEVVVTVERIRVTRASTAKVLPPETVKRSTIPPTEIKATRTWHKFAVPVTPNGRPMIAIVFDDLGIDKSRTRRAIALPGPMSMSNWKRLPRKVGSWGLPKESRKPGNWLPMDPETTALIVRQNYLDRDNEEIARLSIEILDRSEAPPPLEAASFAQALQASKHPSLQASDFPVFPLAVLGPSSCKTYPKAAKVFLPFRSSLLFFILLHSASHSTSSSSTIFLDGC